MRTAAILRGTFGAVVSVVLTLLSLQLVASLNAGAQVQPPEPLLPARTVPLAPPPPELEPPPSVVDSSSEPLAPTEAPAPPVDAPPPAPPQVSALAGLAPTAGPGSLAVGPMGGLPSVAGLPKLATPSESSESGEPDTPARAVSRPAPAYPALAQRRGIEGYVTLRLRIDERGRVTDAVVVKSEPEGTFDKTATATARRYRFTPARANGKPVASTIEQTIRFELKR